jgi:hypothetical protein
VRRAADRRQAQRDLDRAQQAVVVDRLPVGAGDDARAGDERWDVVGDAVVVQLSWLRAQDAYGPTWAASPRSPRDTEPECICRADWDDE